MFSHLVLIVIHIQWCIIGLLEFMNTLRGIHWLKRLELGSDGRKFETAKSSPSKFLFFYCNLSCIFLVRCIK